MNLRSLDRELVSAAKKVRVLRTLGWPAETEITFLHAWRSGNRALPTPPEVSLFIDTTPFDALAKRLDRADPLQAFLARTNDGYRTAARMLTHAHTPEFTRHSRTLFGAPDSQPVTGGPTVLEEAEFLLQTLDNLDVPVEPATYNAAAAQRWLQAGIDEGIEGLPVVLDPDMGSLAAAGSKRVRIRDGVRYSNAQLHQLLHHEAWVHSGTKRNGRRQPLGVLGLSSPRTTAVQEGLATLAEIITDSVDLWRLRRIALRVRLVHHALEGADFLEIFEMLLAEGHPETEAYRSTMRIFRGGDVRGRTVFTKDVVYLSGLRTVHGFLLSALSQGRADLPSVLFAGRMTCGDALTLAPYIEDGTLLPADIVPPWASRTGRLGAYLAWAAFGKRVDVGMLDSFRH